MGTFPASDFINYEYNSQITLFLRKYINWEISRKGDN